MNSIEISNESETERHDWDLRVPHSEVIVASTASL